MRTRTIRLLMEAEMKKLIAFAFIIGTVLSMVPNGAEAVVCARGVYRAGCVGAGTVVAKPSAAGTVVTGSVHRGVPVYRGRVYVRRR
jgi:hypothetical protein